MKILVFEPNYLGDILMTVPAIRLLRSQYKDASVTAVVKAGMTEVLNGYVDGFIERPLQTNLIGRLGLLNKVRAEKPDMAVLFRTTFSSAVIAFFSGAHERVGVNIEFAAPFLTKKLNRDVRNSPTGSFCEEYVELVRLAGAAGQASRSPAIAGQAECKLKINIPEDAQVFADKLLKEYGVTGSGVIVVSPGSSRPAKMWSAGNFARLIDKFEPSAKIFITGTSSEGNLIESIIKLCRKNSPVSLAGKTTIPRLAALLSRCSLFIGPDSGALYLAVASGIRVIGLFGSTDPALYGPFNDGDVLIYKKEPCGPCYEDECSSLSFCMDKITVDEVFRNAGQILKKNGK
jgi:heptosyltransferase-2